jgi:hypothetical protein
VVLGDGICILYHIYYGNEINWYTEAGAGIFFLLLAGLLGSFFILDSTT